MSDRYPSIRPEEAVARGLYPIDILARGGSYAQLKMAAERVAKGSNKEIIGQWSHAEPKVAWITFWCRS